METQKINLIEVEDKIIPTCPKCSSKDTRYRPKRELHNLCRRCGMEWNQQKSGC